MLIYLTRAVIPCIMNNMKKALKDNFLSMDLEMNQPSGRIIQIGAVVGNLKTGKILAEFNQLVCIDDEPLCEDDTIFNVPKSTGITEDRLHADGIPLDDAYEKLCDFKKKYNCNTTPIVWGGNDAKYLRDELERDYKMEFQNKRYDKAKMFIFGFRILDIKTFFQFFIHAKGGHMQSGLKKSMKRVGLEFVGKNHDALSDAINTFRFANFFFHLMDGFQENKSE